MDVNILSRNDSNILNVLLFGQHYFNDVKIFTIMFFSKAFLYVSSTCQKFALSLTINNIKN